MPEIPDNGVVEFVIEGRHNGYATVNTFFVQWRSEILGQTIAQANLLTQLVAAFSGPYQAAVSSDWTGWMARVRDPRTIPVWAFAEVGIGGWQGQAPADACPPSVAAVITRRTGEPGRSKRGRIYVPAVPKVWAINGALTAAGVAEIQALATAMVVDHDLAAPEGFAANVQWSKKLQNWYDITSAVVRTTLRSQRRRELGVGI